MGLELSHSFGKMAVVRRLDGDASYAEVPHRNTSLLLVLSGSVGGSAVKQTWKNSKDAHTRKVGPQGQQLATHAPASSTAGVHSRASLVREQHNGRTNSRALKRHAGSFKLYPPTALLNHRSASMSRKPAFDDAHSGAVADWRRESS